jgi:hypothetical protein
MRQEHYADKGYMAATDLNREHTGLRQKQPWQTPELQEADYEITAIGPRTGGDKSGLS